MTISSITTFVFWVSAWLLAYTNLGFPLLLFVRARLFPLPEPEGYGGRALEPFVSIVVCARDEEDTIGEKLRNLAALDYPQSQIEIVVASDGSKDETERIVRECGIPNVTLLALPRRGKIPALNGGIAVTTGEVLVFSDANSLLRPDALRWLVAPLCDPEVGGCAGDQRYLDEQSNDPAGESAYWSIERSLKKWQSAAGSVTSATGSIYAIRRSIVTQVPAGVTDDFFLSTGVVANGLRLVFEERAVAEEPPITNDFQRKVRIVTRGLRGVWIRRSLLDPRKFGFYSHQLLMHKVVRRQQAWPIVGCITSALLLAGESSFFGVAALLPVGGLGLAALDRSGLPLGPLGRVSRLARYFFAGHVAAAIGTWRALTGRTVDAWNPRGGGPALDAREQK